MLGSFRLSFELVHDMPFLQTSKIRVQSRSFPSYNMYYTLTNTLDNTWSWSLPTLLPNSSSYPLDRLYLWLVLQTNWNWVDKVPILTHSGNDDQTALKCWYSEWKFYSDFILFLWILFLLFSFDFDVLLSDEEIMWLWHVIMIVCNRRTRTIISKYMAIIWQPHRVYIIDTRTLYKL